MKFFNTAGPVNRDNHYKLDPVHRLDLDEIISLIEQEKYFILHAPRQTGKTSSLLALQDHLNKKGKYRTVYVNFEIGQAARNDIDSGIRAIVQNLFSEYQLSFELERNKWDKIEKETTANELLGRALSYLSELSIQPVILLIDEIDSLIGDTLISVLRQIRAGYPKRPEEFPQTIILCGVRDIKDYRIHTSKKEIITGGSAFNIKAVSLKLGNFSEQDVRRLYNEHTKETGQQFKEECFPLIMDYTNGQPWLVNALAYETTFEMKENRDRSIALTAKMIEEAKERIILSGATHLDQLADKLKEDRVRRVLAPMLLGTIAKYNDDDAQYCLDLGLIKDTDKGYEVSNDIYKEVIPRELTSNQQNNFKAIFEPEWINTDDSINTDKLLSMFQQFWRENSDIWASHIAGYQEAAPQLVFQAFLQRVANGKGYVNREYALGRKRTDLMLKWNSSDCEQRIVMELKVLTPKDSYKTIIEKALEQTTNYADKCKATEVHIIIFARSEKTNWEEKIFTETCEYRNRKIKIWGM